MVIIKDPKMKKGSFVYVDIKIQVEKRNRHTILYYGNKKRNVTTINLTYKCFAFYFGFFSTEMRVTGLLFLTSVLKKPKKKKKKKAKC